MQANSSFGTISLEQLPIRTDIFALEVTSEENVIVNVISDKSITVLTDTDRKLFSVLFSCILISSLLLNIGAIWTIIKRNYRFFQKTCIFALSVSDMITVIIFSINYMDLFSHPYVNWTLGNFMCHFVPMCQSFGVISSSMALLMIAMDRYRNIVKALNKRWDPRKRYCIIGVVSGWIICAGMSIPMFIFYSNEMVIVIFLDKYGNVPINYRKETLFMCVATDKDSLSKSFLVFLIFVFTPLIFVFFWFYFKIAKLIWRHRKPIQTEAEDKMNVSVTESSMITSSDYDKNYVQQKIMAKNNNNEQMKRKLRTFKVIIFLIINFIVCRLPFWIFTTLKLSYPLTGLAMWRLNILIIALNIFNTILNPLCYTYLNITLKILRCISKQMNAFLCCFFSDDEFVEFEKRKSVFVDNKIKESIYRHYNEKKVDSIKFGKSKRQG